MAPNPQVPFMVVREDDHLVVVDRLAGGTHWSAPLPDDLRAALRTMHAPRIT